MKSGKQHSRLTVNYWQELDATGMGASRHGQEREGALAPPSGHVKCFQALVVTAKRSVDELFMHYFHNLSSASGGKSAQTPTGVLSLDSMGTFVARPLICPPLEKNPAGTHGNGDQL